MRRRKIYRFRWGVSSVFLALTVMCAGPNIAGAQQPDERQAASRAFADGERHFSNGDFLLAAAAFEEAYKHAPHDAALWNAARSWHKAGQLDRAANLYSHFLKEAPASAPDRDQATAALLELASKLGRFDVQASGVTDVRVGGKEVQLPTVYVTPGEHVWTAKADGQVIQRTERISAGSAISIVLSAPSSTASASAAASPSAPLSPPPPQIITVVVPPPVTRVPTITASRASTIAVGGVALVLLGLTVASGIDTLQARNAYDRSETNADKRKLYFDGVAKQERTNILVAATVGGFVLTGGGVAWIVLSERSTSAVPAASRQTGPTGLVMTIRGEF